MNDQPRYSDDGQFYWSGSEWKPVVRQAAQPRKPTSRAVKVLGAIVLPPVVLLILVNVAFMFWR